MEDWHLAPLIQIEGVVNVDPLVLRELVVVQVDHRVDVVLAAKVHVKLSVICWKHAHWTAKPVKRHDLVERWIDSVVAAELDEVALAFIEVPLSIVATQNVPCGGTLECLPCD